MRAVILHRKSSASPLLRFIAVLALVTIAAAPAHSQTLHGQVVDSVEAEPIAGLQIVLLNAQRDTVAVTRSGSDGRFVLNVPEGEYTLYTRCIGRKPKQVAVKVPSDTPVLLRLAQINN